MITQTNQASQKIFHLLKEAYTEAKVPLDYKNPLELLVATILSAQCIDKRVNIVTEVLFKKYKTVTDYAGAGRKEFEKDIKSTGFYKNKAKNIILSCKKIIDDYGGKVPDAMDALLTLPGVARKTANIVLSNAYGKIEGIAVDTHVKRVSYRLGFTRNQDPNKIEQDLMKLFPKKDWFSINHTLIAHGRKICQAKKPLCPQCTVAHLCPSKKLFYPA